MHIETVMRSYLWTFLNAEGAPRTFLPFGISRPELGELPSQPAQPTGHDHSGLTTD